MSEFVHTGVPMNPANFAMLALLSNVEVGQSA